MEINITYDVKLRLSRNFSSFLGFARNLKFFREGSEWFNHVTLLKLRHDPDIGWSILMPLLPRASLDFIASISSFHHHQGKFSRCESLDCC
jgi:hypothetical protein